MADLIQNVQEVYKKWERRAAPDFSGRGRRNYGAGRSYLRSSNSFDNTHYTRKYRQHNRTPFFKVNKFAALAQFKMAPCVVAENKPRPFMGTCCAKCLPISRATVTDKRVFSLSICNVLHIPHFRSMDFSMALNIFKNKKPALYPDVSADVLKSEVFEHAMEIALEEHRGDSICEETASLLKSELLNRARDTLELLKTSVSSLFLQVSSLFLHHILSRILDGVLVHKGQIEILQTICEGDIPLVYLPIHHSPIDHFFISFILYMNSLKMPLVATDADFYIPIVRYFTKFLGVFYVQRCQDYSKANEDLVYSAVLESYLTECLKAGHSLEFPIGNRRLTSGQMQNSGLLSKATSYQSS